MLAKRSHWLSKEIGLTLTTLIDAKIESFRFEDEDEDQDENEDQGQLLLTVRMLKSVTVMA